MGAYTQTRLVKIAHKDKCSFKTIANCICRTLISVSSKLLNFDLTIIRWIFFPSISKPSVSMFKLAKTRVLISEAYFWLQFSCFFPSVSRIRKRIRGMNSLVVITFEVQKRRSGQLVLFINSVKFHVDVTNKQTNISC